MQSKITIVAPAYNEESHQMPFIDSMLNQKEQTGWQCIVYHNGPYDSCRGYAKYKEQLSADSRFIFRESPINTGNWGTANRQQVIDTCDSEYIIQSSIHDYWLPQAIGYILKTIERTNVDIIYWDTINHIVGECRVLDGQLAWAHCDWGQFALKTSIAKAVGIKRGDVYCGDWAFVEDCLNSGLIKTKCKLPLIINIHN